MTGSSTRTGAGRTYIMGIAVAIFASLLIVWTTIVRDDGSGAGFFVLIMAVGVGWSAALDQAAGMARTMFGIAVMQTMLGIAMATAPITASTPDGPLKSVLFNGFFTALWLISAVLFRAAAKADRKAGEAL